MEKLLAAVDRAFANPPDVDLSDGCSRCYPSPSIALLEGDPALVPTDLLIRVLMESMDHWETEQWRLLWRRLAPNTLRLFAYDLGAVDTGWALRTLDYAEFPAWPDGERLVLENALGGVLEYALTHNAPIGRVTELLGGLASAYDDIAPWFARIDAMTGPQAEAGVLRLVFEWITELLWGHEDWFGWWWPEDPTAIVRAWLCSPAVRHRVADFAAQHPDCKTAADTLIAYSALDRGEYGPWYAPGMGFHQMEAWGQPTSYAWLQPVQGSLSPQATI
jgi:hypothetical protein